jgi:large subunit ribosomal protein L22
MEANETKLEAVAHLRNVPTSPRKARLMADLIRGMQVTRALAVLKFQPQHSSEDIAKVLKSAIANYAQKFEDQAIEELVVKTIFVNEGRMLKRVQPAPQGRAHRIRKRSNHITVVVHNPLGFVAAPLTADSEAEISTEPNTITQAQ